jgi:hypothetical protein
MLAKMPLLFLLLLPLPVTSLSASELLSCHPQLPVSDKLLFFERDYHLLTLFLGHRLPHHREYFTDRLHDVERMECQLLSGAFFWGKPYQSLHQFGDWLREILHREMWTNPSNRRLDGSRLTDPNFLEYAQEIESQVMVYMAGTNSRCVHRCCFESQQDISCNETCFEDYWRRKFDELPIKEPLIPMLDECQEFSTPGEATFDFEN